MSNGTDNEQRTDVSYYKYFDDQSNGGRVFTADLSTFEDLPVKHLTDAERLERVEWRNKLRNVQEHYLEIDSPQHVTSTEILLQQRVMIPHLGSTSVSSRSQLRESRRGRRYPDLISAWTGFVQQVDSFKPLHKALNPKQMHIFLFSSALTDYSISLSDEKEEETFMLQVLKKALMSTGITGEITTRGGLGRPDAIVLQQLECKSDLPEPADIGLIAEFKSTHNLPLPMAGGEVATAYNNAYNDVIKERGGRSPLWARVCHPIGQLLGYMVENGRRYGALSSATRAYFIRIDGSGSDARVYISDAFCVGQPNFLRAWAFVQSLACQQTEQLVSNQLKWQRTSRDQPTPPPKIRRTGSRRSSGTGTMNEASEDEDRGTADPNANSASGLTEVSIDDVQILSNLGYGHNGVVYLAKWGERRVALKQFDIGKDGYEYFDKEIAAYWALKDAWGKLVTTPLFVSESWSGWIKFIGLQLGRKPEPGDDVSDWSTVLTSLESQYGFRHEDDDGNMVFVTDEKTGTERLVAIDLEAHSIIGA